MLILGVDEVGRGCWAGPLVAAAVVFDTDSVVMPGLDDSKKLGRRSRETLDPLIRASAVSYGIGWVQPAAIDISGITDAVKRAMTDAVMAALAALTGRQTGEPIDIVVDGSYNFLADMPLAHGCAVRTLVGADGLVPAVSAASIIAKVARDSYMTSEAHTLFPEYGFDRHVGYGTAAHVAALTQFGVTPLHRQSFKPIKAMVQSRP